MFTGIVQGTAEIAAVVVKDRFQSNTVIMPSALVEGLQLGASVAHNGCCLTVTAIDGNHVSFDLIDETLSVTNLDQLVVGDSVNIERAARFSDEIGGHLLSGHVMATAKICQMTRTDCNYELSFELDDPTSLKYVFHKGYIGIDGISLTVDYTGGDTFSVHLIPETLSRTTLGAKGVGDIVNIEFDTQTQTIVDTVERVMKGAKSRPNLVKLSKAA